MDRAALVGALREIARRLALRGDDPFRARAYERAADAIDEVLENLDTLVAEGRLTEIEGVGKAIAALVTELHHTGKAAVLEALRAEMPPGILELADASRLSADKLRTLRESAGITTAEALEEACRAGRVRQLRGFGPKTEAMLLERLVRARTRLRRTLLSDALAAAARLARDLEAEPGVLRVHVAGEVRRFQEVVTCLDLVVETDAPEAVRARLSARAPTPPEASPPEGPLHLGVREGVPVAVWLATPGALGTVLHRATGSADHVDATARLALERGRSLEGAATERELYGRLGLPEVPPELRDDAGALDAAQGGRSPTDLLAPRDLVGMVHCHTVYSDGRDGIEAMARAAEALGCRYITITDHSPSAVYARGVSLERLRAQWDEIAAVQQRVGIRILRGLECDILPSGELDCPDDILEQLDVVIASIHVRARMDAEAMTARIVRAMRHPCFKIWGHPLGRLLERRPPVDCRVEEILDVIAASRAAIEINADPHRLDLEPRWLREAARRGIRFVVSTDAHSVAGMGCAPFGVGMARRAGLGPTAVLNTLDADAFCRAVRPAAGVGV